MHVLDSSQFDTEEICARLTEVLERCDRLIARSEYDLVPAALLRERFSIVGDKPDAVLPMRDKLLMRRLCRTASILQPGFWTLDEFQPGPASRRYVLKPRMEASSVGISTGTSSEIMAKVERLHDATSFFVEEFVAGRIFHVDGFVSRGKLEAVVTSEYVGNCLDYASGAPLGSTQVPLDAKAIEITQRTLEALGHENGSFHFEGIIDDDGRYHFLEAASRVGGAGVADTFELKTGVNLYHADLRQQLFGEHVRLDVKENSEFFGWFVYPGHGTDAPLRIEFDPDKWRAYLVSHVCNKVTSRSAAVISYGPHANPLSGVVRGRVGELKGVIESIFSETAVMELAA